VAYSLNKYLILAGLVAAVAYVGWVQSGQDADRNTGQNGGPLAQVKVPVLQGDAIEGQRIFDARCAACHGVNAAGKGGAGPPLVHRIYRPSIHGDLAFLLAVRNGVRAHHWRFGSMLPQDGLSDGDVSKIVAYVRALQRENGIS